MESNKLIERCFIIALSGYDDIKEKENCYRVGFDAFVSKPIKIVDIISVVNEVRNSKWIYNNFICFILKSMNSRGDHYQKTYM